MISLEPLSQKHLEGNYLSWFGDAEVCRFNRYGERPLSREEGASYIESIADADDALVLAIHDENTREHWGNISLQKIDWQQKSGEIAILLGERAAWGRGVSTAAWCEMVRVGFEVLGLELLYCGTDSRNIGMRRVAEKAGMRLVKSTQDVLIKPGQKAEVLHYELARPSGAKAPAGEMRTRLSAIREELSRRPRLVELA